MTSALHRSPANSAPSTGPVSSQWLIPQFSKQTTSLFLGVLIACYVLAPSARALELKSVAGGALFPGSAGIQTYYAQVTAGKNPLLKTYVFLAGEHFYALLRENGSGGGSFEYEAYANGGASRKGRGSFSLQGGVLKAIGSKGFRLTLKITGARLQIKYAGLAGKYRAAGSLRRF